MKIPHPLPQFKNRRTCIIVAGKQTAALYIAADGVIERIDSIKIPAPHYSDDEGRFGRRGRGTVIGSGAPKEIDDQDIIRDFLKEFKEKIKMISDIDEIYILAPDQTKKKIEDALPSTWKEKPRTLISGNYYYRAPTDIVRRISEE